MIDDDQIIDFLRYSTKVMRNNIYHSSYLNGYFWWVRI